MCFARATVHVCITQPRSQQLPSPHDVLTCVILPSSCTEGKIKELINALDMRKDEAIERTFKGVAKNFR